MSILKDIEQSSSEYLPLLSVLKCFEEAEGSDSVKETATRLAEFSLKKHSYLWASTPNGKWTHCLNALETIGNAENNFDPSSLQIGTLRMFLPPNQIDRFSGDGSYDSNSDRIYIEEPVYLNELRVKASVFVDYLFEMYSLLKAPIEDLETRWIPVLKNKWPAAAQELVWAIDLSNSDEDVKKKGLGENKEKTYLRMIGLLTKAIAENTGVQFGNSETPNKSQIFEHLIAPHLEPGKPNISASTFSDYVKNGLRELKRF